MAAWLAYLKSRLLLPKPEQPRAEEAPAEEMAARLAFRLAKLEAMREAGERLRTGPQLGREVFVRGDPEAIRIIPSDRIEGDLYSLMSAYIGQRQKEIAAQLHARHAAGLSAGGRPRPPAPAAAGSGPLDARSPASRRWARPPPGRRRASYLASTLSASLELVKEGDLEARQMEAFADIYLRARKGDAVAPEAVPMSDRVETAREIEALLFAAAGPLTAAEMARRLPEGADVDGRARGAGGALRGAGRGAGQRRRRLALPDRRRTWPG